MSICLFMSLMTSSNCSLKVQMCWTTKSSDSRPVWGITCTGSITRMRDPSCAVISASKFLSRYSKSTRIWKTTEWIIISIILVNLTPDHSWILHWTSRIQHWSAMFAKSHVSFQYPSLPKKPIVYHSHMGFQSGRLKAHIPYICFWGRWVFWGALALLVVWWDFGLLAGPYSTFHNVTSCSSRNTWQCVRNHHPLQLIFSTAILEANKKRFITFISPTLSSFNTTSWTLWMQTALL